MTKQPTLEEMQDAKAYPLKVPHKPMGQWDATELRMAMLDDARRIRENSNAKKLRYANGHNTTANQKALELIRIMKLIGKPCTKHEIADAMGVLPHTAYNIMRDLVMADIVTTDREGSKSPIIYSLVDGYDDQKQLDL